ncbi:MAG: EAL domain-containing protein [Angelakisella sp.]
MWHMEAEMASLLFMAVIIVDLVTNSTTKTLKDKLFNSLALGTFGAILIDIVSTVTMIWSDLFPRWSLQAGLVLYFITTPMLAMLWHLYAIAVVNKPTRKIKNILLLSAIPFALYAGLVLASPLTGWIFWVAPNKDYSRGVLFPCMFIIFYGYALATLLYAMVKFKKIERTTAVILTIFPLIAGVGILIQHTWQSYLLTGTAYTLVLLITYLFLQNRKRTRDSLTGLYNRLAFSDAIERLSRADENGFVMAIAVDDFKLFNQTFGQPNGDEVLKSIGEYLVSVSPSKTCYRYGGDIFALILRKCTTHEAAAIADAIMTNFKDFVYREHIGYSLSVCIGIVEYPYASDSKKHSIVTALDFAVYQAKKGGRGQIAFYNEELIRKFKRKHDVAAALERGLVQNSFEVYLQPVYHMHQKTYAFGEALLRLKDEKLGSVSPGEFIPIAEETGKIVEITYYVLEKVCAFLRDNRAALQDDVTISVNFSVIQFMQKDMAQRVLGIISSYGLPPSLLKIEITESVVATSFDEIKAAMTMLHNFGIRFALDDYGNGYSNIAYLVNLPFDFVKLDKSILDGIVEDDRFLKALVPMFKGLGKTIIAEGVETQQQVDIVSQTACDAIQGYHFAKPMPMEQALTVFSDSKDLTFCGKTIP